MPKVHRKNSLILPQNAGDELHWGDEIHWLSSTGTGSAIFDNCRKLSGRYEIKLTVINGGKPQPP